MKLFRKNHGAVSVFLVIILVPMLVVTSLFVDVARMHLGQAMVDSAGDLALNTAMTEFDQKLNDYFGMLGTCKSSEELKSISETFYKTSLKSAGLSTEDSDDFAHRVAAMFDTDTGTISDLMRLEPVDNSFSMELIENSGFHNPAVVKTQIVNFMKYRSPINGALKLFNSLKEVSEKSKNTEDETKLIAEKQDMCESEQTLMENLKNVHDCLYAYENQSAGDGMKLANTAGMKKLVQEINGYKEKFKACAQQAAINFLYLDMNQAGNFTPTAVKAGTAGICSIEHAFEEMQTCMEDYEKKRDALNKACGINTGNELRDGLVKAIEVPNLYNEFKASAKKLSDAWESMRGAYEKLSDQTEVREEFEQYEADYKEYSKDFDNDPGNDSCYYYKVLKGQVEGVGMAKLNELKQKYNQQKGQLDASISALAGEYTKIYGEISAARENLKNAYSALGSILGDGEGSLKDFLQKEGKWKERASDLKGRGSELGAADVQLYEGEEKKDGQLTDAGIMKGIERNVTPTSVNNLRAHIEKIYSELGAIKGKMELMKFGSDRVDQVTSVDKINEKFRSKISKDQFNEVLTDAPALQSLVQEKFNELYKDTSGELSLSWIDSANSTPVVAGDDLYRWLAELFRKDTSNSDTKKSEYEKYKKKSEEKIKEESDETDEDGLPEQYKKSKNKIEKTGAAELPSKRDASAEASIKVGEKTKDLDKASDTVGSIFSGITNALKEMATGFRDDLYSVDYIMSMFSYDTFVNEGLYDVAEAKNKPHGSLTEVHEAIKDQDVISSWTNESTTNTLNKSLTNKEISGTNNYAFGHEVEYILYGGGSNEGNKLKAYGTIFAIRLGFNAIYGFKEFWSDAWVESASVGISAATLGVIPPALVKLAIILALVIAETVYDISCLKVGMPVAVMKSARTWKMSLDSVFPGESKSSGKGNGQSITDLSLRYSDYLKIFLMISMVAGNENKIYTRTADVIQCNMTKITGNNDYSMSECKTWVTISSRVYVKPLMLDLPWTKDAEGNPRENTSWYTLSYNRSNGYY